MAVGTQRRILVGDQADADALSGGTGRQPMTEADAERLRRWLEVRTKIAQVKLYTE